MKTIAIVIVTWNNEKDIKIVLDSIKVQTFNNYKVIVVDNNSSDLTCEIASRYKWVKLLKRDRNYYLSPSNNYGISFAIKEYSPEYIMVLNPDTKLSENVLELFIKDLDTNSQIGAIGPKLKFFNNKNEGLINSAGLFYDNFLQAYDIGFMQKDTGQFDTSKIVFGVSGACIMYKTHMLKKIGLYWEAITMYMDEVELFIRAEKAGFKVLYQPKAVVYHSYMRSTDQNKLYRMEQYKKKAWLKIALRHYPFVKKLAAIKQFFYTKH